MYSPRFLENQGEEERLNESSPCGKSKLSIKRRALHVKSQKKALREGSPCGMERRYSPMESLHVDVSACGDIQGKEGVCPKPLKCWSRYWLIKEVEMGKE